MEAPAFKGHGFGIPEIWVVEASSAELVTRCFKVLGSGLHVKVNAWFADERAA